MAPIEVHEWPALSIEADEPHVEWTLVASIATHDVQQEVPLVRPGRTPPFDGM